MDQARSLELALRERVTLVRYDASWPLLFSAEVERLQQCLPDTFLDIQHVGSTAVIGMSAKPIVDLLVGVDSMMTAATVAESLSPLGYLFAPGAEAHLPNRRWLMRHQGGRRTHHLHLVVHEGEEWHRMLGFRDLLRCDGRIAIQYAQLKGMLAYRHADDREAYTAAKSEFIEAALASPRVVADALERQRPDRGLRPPS